MKIPENERHWLIQKDAHGQVQYLITSTPDRSVYKLYVPATDTGDWKLVAKNKSAGELARRFKIKS